MARKNLKVERMVRDPRNQPRMVLKRIQAELTPEQQLQMIAINYMNGEFVLGDTVTQAIKKFVAKWPDDPYYFCRADGQPADRL